MFIFICIDVKRFAKKNLLPKIIFLRIIFRQFTGYNDTVDHSFKKNVSSNMTQYFMSRRRNKTKLLGILFFI